MKKHTLDKLSNSIPFLWVILTTISMVSIGIFQYLKGFFLSGALKSWALSIVLISILIFFILSEEIKTKEYPYFTFWFAGVYGIVHLFISITQGKIEYHVWLIGCGVIAAIVSVNLGYIFVFNSVFYAALLGMLSVEKIIYLLVLGIITCLLSEFMKNRKTLTYVIIILLSVDVILLFIIHSFALKETVTVRGVISLVMTTLTVFGIHILTRFYKIHFNSLKLSAVPDEILSTEYPLLKRLKEYSDTTYERSLLISHLAGKGAKMIGADEKLVRAGGLYHEIGHLSKEGNFDREDYIESGVKIVQAYNFNSRISDMIREHNIKYEIPKSPESAVLMLTASIVMSKEYVDNNGGIRGISPPVPFSKIADNVFSMRLHKGSLNESNLTVKQYKILRDFFMQISEAGGFYDFKL